MQLIGLKQTNILFSPNKNYIYFIPSTCQVSMVSIKLMKHATSSNHQMLLIFFSTTPLFSTAPGCNTSYSADCLSSSNELFPSSFVFYTQSSIRWCSFHCIIKFQTAIFKKSFPEKLTVLLYRLYHSRSSLQGKFYV